MNEREFLGWILDLARRGGWRVYHVPYPVRPIGGGQFVPEPRAKGLPDLILLHDSPPRLIFAEVKGPGGKLSAEQVEFLRLARGVADAFRGLLRTAADVIAVTNERPDPETAAAIGVYSWRPGVEPLIEAVLLGKVMVP